MKVITRSHAFVVEPLKPAHIRIPADSIRGLLKGPGDPVGLVLGYVEQTYNLTISGKDALAIVQQIEEEGD